MKVLVLGSGGREHALVKALRRSPRVREVLAAPGNAGIALEARCLPARIDDIPGLRPWTDDYNNLFQILK